MQIIALSDIHSTLTYLPQVSEDLAGADAVLISGDITNFGGYSDAEDVLEPLARLNPRILAVPGNCDLPAVNRCLVDRGMSLHCRTISLDGVAFLGICGWLSCPVDAQQQGVGLRRPLYHGLDQTAAGIPEGSRSVLVTHQPAADTRIDAFGDGRHGGSPELRAWIERHQPVLAVAGHIHEAAGVDVLGETVLVNPGPFRQGSFARIRIEDTVTAEVVDARMF